ncbi:hypothetical protein K437DRAFT_57668, partial [Tilletiaria anomala UBC 951]
MPRSQSPPLQTLRGRMACVFCRQGKHRCDGEPPAALLHQFPGSDAEPVTVQGEGRCHGCKMAGIACQWLPKAKRGRPRLQKDTVRAGDQRQRQQLFSAAPDLLNEWLIGELSQTPASPLQLDGVSSLRPMQGFARSPSSRLSELLPALDSRDIEAFFEQAAPWCPVLGLKHLFMARLQRCLSLAPSLTEDPLIASAYTAAAIGSRVCRGLTCGSDNEGTITAARTAVSKLAVPTSSVFLDQQAVRSMLDAIHALIASVMYEFGVQNLVGAAESLSKAIDFALRASMHRFDAQLELTDTEFLAVTVGHQLHSQSVPFVEAPELAGQVRRT